MTPPWIISCILLPFLTGRAAGELFMPLSDEMLPFDATVPVFGPNFHATVTIIAHLVDASKPYPPSRRRVEVWYDYAHNRSKAYIHSGLEANKTFMRLHGQEDEYAFRLDAHPECRRAILVEPMHKISYPDSMRARHGEFEYEGLRCRLFVSQTALERVKVYVHTQTNIPLKVTSEYREDGKWTPTMTWAIERLKYDEVTDADFVLPPPFTHDTCELVMGGWPSVHVFHHYVRV